MDANSQSGFTLSLGSEYQRGPTPDLDDVPELIGGTTCTQSAPSTSHHGTQSSRSEKDRANDDSEERQKIFIETYLEVIIAPKILTADTLMDFHFAQRGENVLKIFQTDGKVGTQTLALVFCEALQTGCQASPPDGPSGTGAQTNDLGPLKSVLREGLKGQVDEVTQPAAFETYLQGPNIAKIHSMLGSAKLHPSELEKDFVVLLSRAVIADAQGTKLEEIQSFGVADDSDDFEMNDADIEGLVAGGPEAQTDDESDDEGSGSSM